MQLSDKALQLSRSAERKGGTTLHRSQVLDACVWVKFKFFVVAASAH